ncbi:MAG: RNA-binding transcriptional accessory protein [Firmicutes bacterium]|nr:RNA-binding transcriptional accessory protein [Bacillota bacterium]
MNTDIIKQISEDLNIRVQQVEVTLKLLEEGNTIPFIARYRKDITGALDEEKIKAIEEVYNYQVNLLKRKEDVIRLIDEKGLLTDELKSEIMNATKLVEVEDLYRPFKEKKKTKATEAIKNGLEGLAKEIMAFPTTGSIENIAKKYLNENVETIEEAVQGAKYIIAENISDNAKFRKTIRDNTYNYGIIKSKKKKNSIDENKIYDMYYDYEEKVKYIKPHRILALNRGENEGILSVSIDYDKERVLDYLEKRLIKNDKSFVVDIVKDAIEDSYKRLIEPSIEREIRSDLTVIGEDAAISNFAKNLESLLLTPPMKERVVLGFDPGYVNGCKIAVIDKTGKYLDSTVVKPFLKGNQDKLIEQSEIIVKNLISKYNVDIIAIGNGTASRESEKFISNMIKKYNLNCKYVIVSEAGASIYSASKIAIEEFPDLEVEKRSAVSIGRRLQDPLSELVKIPPEGIGVGLYQHDVSGKKLSDNLDFVVSKTVNSVGVNINTASPSILKYVSGITKRNIDKITEYRNSKGRINSRIEIKKLLSDKVYEQAIGFLRITEGDNILDSTGIHPESYNVALNLLNSLNMDLNDVGSKELVEKLDNINMNEYKDKLNTDIYTLEDVVKSLKSPGRDPRDEMPQPLLKSDILELSDLSVGMKLQGTVRNVVDFGAFIDIGLHEDGLVHISKITDKYIKHPSEILSVGDIVDCYVEEIKLDKKKVSLSLIEPK